MTAPYFFVVNPAAGAGAAGRLWPALARRLRDLHLQYEYELTQGPLTATSFVRQALRAGVRTVVGVGGDGTLNEVVNGFFLHEQPIAPDVSLGVIPVGQGSIAIAAAAPHRDAAFAACRYVIEEVKKRLPIWKKELRGDGTGNWVEVHDHR